MDNIFKDKIILVTGAAGTIGKELVRQLINYNPSEIRGLDHNESELFMMNEIYSNYNNINFFIGDIRDIDKMEEVSRGVNIIFHCAALKHVYFSEYNPFEAIQTNILGVKNILKASLKNEVDRVIFTSSDKAVNPTNVMGTSKLMGERLVTAANVVNPNSRQIFSSVRFGNVLGSRGSVVPIFYEQIKKGGPVTITDPGMTRFIMTVEQSVGLVLESAHIAKGGEVMVTKMAAIYIMDLAKAMIDILAPLWGFDPNDINIKIIGAKPGEKMYEELISEEEINRTIELHNMFVVLPAFRSIYKNIIYDYPNMIEGPKKKKYSSNLEQKMSLENLKNYLLINNIIKNF